MPIYIGTVCINDGYPEGYWHCQCSAQQYELLVCGLGRNSDYVNRKYMSRKCIVVCMDDMYSLCTYIDPCGSQSKLCWTALMRANKLETAVRSMPLCSGPPDFFMYIYQFSPSIQALISQGTDFLYSYGHHTAPVRLPQSMTVLSEVHCVVHVRVCVHVCMIPV